jgi:hypothetical protein
MFGLTLRQIVSQLLKWQSEFCWSLAGILLKPPIGLGRCAWGCKSAPPVLDSLSLAPICSAPSSFNPSSSSTLDELILCSPLFFPLLLVCSTRRVHTHSSSSSLYYNNQHTPIYLRFCCGSVCVCVRVFVARDGGMQPASQLSKPPLYSLARSFSHVFGNFHKIRRAQYFLSAFTARPESYMRWESRPAASAATTRARRRVRSGCIAADLMALRFIVCAPRNK